MRHYYKHCQENKINSDWTSYSIQDTGCIECLVKMKHFMYDNSISMNAIDERIKILAYNSDFDILILGD